MERARTAREAVEIIGGLIDKYGYATYGGNSHLFADCNEGWILINFAGGQKLWVAQRLGADDIRVSRPGYIGIIPENFRAHPDFKGSANLISFAVKQGWYDPKSGQPFNVHQVYGDGLMCHPAVALMEKRLGELRGKIGLKEIMAAVRAPEVTRDSAGYGQVAHLRAGVHRELGVLWVAGAAPLTAPFIPYHLGVTDVPPEFKRHRYLTAGEAARFQDPDHQGLESTKSAFRICKRLFYLAKEHEKKFLPEVTEALAGFEDGLRKQQTFVERAAEKLFQSGEPELARGFLTYYSGTEALNGLRLAEALSQGLEARTKVLFGVRSPGVK
jgi:dipeptidase